MVICAFSYNPLTKQSHYEAEYLATIGKYKDHNMAAIFPESTSVFSASNGRASRR